MSDEQSTDRNEAWRIEFARLKAENDRLRAAGSIFGTPINLPTQEQDALRQLGKDINSVGQNAYISPALQNEIAVRFDEVLNRKGMTVAIASVLVDALGELTMLD